MAGLGSAPGSPALRCRGMLVTWTCGARPIALSPLKKRPLPRRCTASSQQKMNPSATARTGAGAMGAGGRACAPTFFLQPARAPADAPPSRPQKKGLRSQAEPTPSTPLRAAPAGTARDREEGRAILAPRDAGRGASAKGERHRSVTLRKFAQGLSGPGGVSPPPVRLDPPLKLGYRASQGTVRV